MHHLRQAETLDLEAKSYFAGPDPELDGPDEAILLALSEQPFASVRQLARIRHLSRFTGYSP
jgi:hypothetical protein